MSETWAFIDEYGNADLVTDVEGVSKLYVVTAVVLDASHLDQARAALDPIRRAHFRTAPMKGQKLGDDRAAWVSLLTALSEVPFGLYALVTDKAAIHRASGPEWKQSFYKNICKRVYGKLMKSYPGLHVRADGPGPDAFKETFARYIEAHHRPTLFDRGTFDFVPAREDVLVQLADVMCGLLVRCYDPDRRLARPEELLGLLRERVLLLDEWPPRFRLTSRVELESSSSPDERIGGYAIGKAEEYVVKHEDDIDPDARCRVAVLERLLCERRLGDGEGSVHGAELVRMLEERGLAPKSRRWLSTAVVGSLRDLGVLITSSSLGFKLPTRASDLTSFARQAEGQCIPMLNRLESACDAVRALTNGEIDVLSSPELAVVRRLLAAVDGHAPTTTVAVEDV